MGDEILIIIILLIGGFVLFYFLSASGALGSGLKDIFAPTKKVLDTGAEGVSSAFNFLGIVGGDKKEGESCQEGKTACGDGLVCDAGICHKGTAKVGERCTAGVNQMNAVDYFPLVAAVSGGYAKKGGIECENGAGCINNICVQNPKEAGDKCYPDKAKCPSGLTCYPRTGWGKCYTDPADLDQFCTNDEGRQTGAAAGYGAAAGVAGGPVGIAVGAAVGAAVGSTQGKPGSNNIKCKSGLTCYIREGGGIEGVCHRSKGAKLGEVCVLSGEAGNPITCDTGLVCNNGKCTDECRTGGKGCPGGYTCYPNTGPGKCVPNRTYVEGGVCDTKGANRVECGEDLACVNNKCYRMPEKAGDYCATGTNLKCPGKLSCSPRDGSLGTCK